jgi:hypothetical protein
MIFLVDSSQSVYASLDEKLVMLMTVVIDPDVFEAAEFAQPLYRGQAELLFRGLQTNGLVLVDPTGRLWEEVLERLEKLPSKLGQQLVIRAQELAKNKRSKIIKVDPQVCQVEPSFDLFTSVRKIAEACKADTMIVTSQGKADLQRDGQGVGAITVMSTYLESAWESERHNFLELQEPIDRLPKDRMDDLLIRCLRFTKWIRIYDKQIGKGYRAGHFLRGIEYILNLWRNHCHWQVKNDFFVEIITCPRHKIFGDEGAIKIEEKTEENRRAWKLVLDGVIEPLKAYNLWGVKWSVKDDCDGIMHARYLQTQSAVVLFDRGFDLFDMNGSVKRNELKVMNVRHEHLEECRRLPMAAV